MSGTNENGDNGNTSIPLELLPGWALTNVMFPLLNRHPTEEEINNFALAVETNGFDVALDAFAQNTVASPEFALAQVGKTTTQFVTDMFELFGFDYYYEGELQTGYVGRLPTAEEISTWIAAIDGAVATPAQLVDYILGQDEWRAGYEALAGQDFLSARQSEPVLPTLPQQDNGGDQGGTGDTGGNDTTPGGEDTTPGGDTGGDTGGNDTTPGGEDTTPGGDNGGNDQPTWPGRYAPEVEAGLFTMQVYYSLLERFPNDNGGQLWSQQQLVGGLDPYNLVRGVAGSDEFAQRHASKTNAQFVDHIFFQMGYGSVDGAYGVAGRDANSYEKASWTAAIDQGLVSRLDFTVYLSLRPEWAQGMENFYERDIWADQLEGRMLGHVREMVVDFFYGSLIDRQSDEPGLQYWLDQMDAEGAFIDRGALARGISGSQEFIQLHAGMNNTQFVREMYREILGREAEQQGLQNWVANLDAGAISRQDMATWVLEASTEFEMRIEQTFHRDIWSGAGSHYDWIG